MRSPLIPHLEGTDCHCKRIMFCRECGSQMSEGSRFCRSCGARIGSETVNTKPILEQIEASPYICPKCKHNKITKYSLYQKQNKSGNGSDDILLGFGCIGCLLFVIIAILAPGLAALVAIAVGASTLILAIPVSIVTLVVIAIILIIKAYESELYICERCGHKFKP